MPHASANSPPWTDPGWRDSALAWIDSALTDLARPRTSPVADYKAAWAGSAVLTMETAGGRLFFKATAGVPPEAAVLARLAERHPDSLPRLLACDAARGWQLVEDFGGRTPSSPADHIGVLQRLADLQRRETAHIPEWRALGCRDRGLPWLRERLDDLLGRLPPVLAEHGLIPHPLATDLTAAADDAAAICVRLETLLPLDGLHHEDCRPGNAAITTRGPLLFDWADTVIAHPFFSAQRYLDDVAAPDGAGHPSDWSFRDHDPRRLLQAAYLDGWKEVAPQADLDEAFALTRVLEPLYQLARYDAALDLMAWAASNPAPEETALADLVFGQLAHVRPGWRPGAISL